MYSSPHDGGHQRDHWHPTEYQNHSAPAYERDSLFTQSNQPKGHSQIDSTEIQGIVKEKTTKVKSPFAQINTLILGTIVATGAFAFTSWFAQATFQSERMSSAFSKTSMISLRNTLGILRTGQEITSVLTGYVLHKTFEVIDWTQVSGRHGIGMLSFLTLSPSTTLNGVAAIALGRSSRLPDRAWAVTRLLLVGIMWAAGFVLFCKS